MTEEDLKLYEAMKNEIIQKGFSYYKKSLPPGFELNPDYMYLLYDDIFNHYSSLVKQGLDVKDMFRPGTELNIKILISYFEEVEQYEKCAVLKDIENKIKSYELERIF